MNVSTRGRKVLRLTQGFAFAGLGAYAAQATTGFCGSGANGFFETWVYDGLIFTAAAMCLARAYFFTAQRTSWLVLGIGLTLWGAGDAYYAIFLAHLDSPPLPSPSDALWLAFYPACYVAIVLLVRDRVREFRSTLWLDGLVGALAASAIGAALVFGAIIGSGGGATIVAVDLTYALGDLVLLGFVIGVFALTGWRPGLALFLVGTGLVISAIVDSFFLYGSATGSVPGTTLVATLWPMGALLMGCAAWQRPAPATAMRLEGWRVFLMPSAFALSGLGLLAFDTFESLNPLALILAMATLGAVIVRMALTFRENVRLLNSSRKEALTDALTGLGNRRKLMYDLEHEFPLATDEAPRGLLLFDLDGFKQYNDRYGHPLGDALLARLGRRLSAAVKSGAAYRLGGDEFCVIGHGSPMEIMEITEASREALSEQGEGFNIESSCGVAMIPGDASDIKVALHIADERLYAQKNGRQRFSVSRETGAALLQALEEREPDLRGHLDKVAELSRSVASKLGLSGQDLDDVTRAAQLHDVGKVAVPDAVLQKAGPLDPMEWDFMHQHTIVGERILNAAPALTSVAKLVRSSHERYDGQGYPDGMAGDKIPLGARVISACDAFHAMTSTRPYGRSMTPDEALDELLRCANLQFDPNVVEALCEIVTTAANESDADTSKSHAVAGANENGNVNVNANGNGNAPETAGTPSRQALPVGADA